MTFPLRSRSSKVLLALGVFAVFVWAAPHLFDGESEDAPRRDTATSFQFVQLSHGKVHYQLTQSSSTAETLVMIHGVSGPMVTWDRLLPTLDSARVLRYDLYGRGGSDRVAGPYNRDLYDQQLLELLDVLKIHEPVTLVGSSMGAIIAAEFTQRHADRVARVILIGPAGFPIQASPAARLLDLPGVGDWAIAVLGDRMLSAHQRRYVANPEKATVVDDAFRAQLRVRGTKAAILSTMREMPVRNYIDGFGALGRSGKPVLLIWGKNDQTFPFVHHGRAQELLPTAVFAPIDDAAHLPQWETPEEVGSTIEVFIN